MGSGRVPTCIGVVAVLAVLAAAPTASAQAVRRVAALDEPFGGVAERGERTLPTMSPVPPRTSYQPPRRDPDGVPYEPDFTLPDGSAIPLPQSKSRQVRLGRRYNTPNNEDSVRLPDGTRRSLLTGGWVVNVESADGKEATEFAADDVVIWVRGLAIDNVQGGFATPGDGRTQVEVYMAGNVIVRTTRGAPGKKVSQTLRAEEVYYDAENNRAVAVRADLELQVPNSPDPFHMRGEEVRRLDLENWEILRGTASASKLPSDPALRLDSERFTLSERRVVRRNIFGLPFRDLRSGEQVQTLEQIVTGRNVVTRLGGVPVGYLPTLRTNASDPLGPLQSIGYSQSRQFGPSVYTTWDVFELLALRPPPGHSARLDLDYLGKRGPAAGGYYQYRVDSTEPFGPPIGAGLFKVYGISDHGTDLLGGYRGPEPTQPDLRGRVLWRHQQEVMEGLYFQGQLALLSDKNFLEQYYKNEFDTGPNQETFAYLAWQRRNFGATALVEDRIGRQWMGETNALPRVDGHLIGQTFLNDLFVYSARGSAMYAQGRPSEISPFPVLSTDQRVDTGRFDLVQELSVPFALGPVKLAPYASLDLTEYTNDLTGNETGRVIGAGGARASIPFSRLYGDVSSELLNLRGLYHKVTFGANYRYARSNEPYTRFPMLDRQNDDATDQAFRNIVPYQSQFVPGPNGVALMNAGGYSPFNPQLYAIRRVVESRVDTLDSVNVLQADVRQRFQTKRGYPGMEHTVDVALPGRVRVVLPRRAAGQLRPPVRVPRVRRRVERRRPHRAGVQRVVRAVPGRQPVLERGGVPEPHRPHQPVPRVPPDGPAQQQGGVAQRGLPVEPQVLPDGRRHLRLRAAGGAVQPGAADPRRHRPDGVGRVHLHRVREQLRVPVPGGAEPGVVARRRAVQLPGGQPGARRQPPLTTHWFWPSPVAGDANSTELETCGGRPCPRSTGTRPVSRPRGRSRGGGGTSSARRSAE